MTDENILDKVTGNYLCYQITYFAICVSLYEHLIIVNVPVFLYTSITNICLLIVN